MKNFTTKLIKISSLVLALIFAVAMTTNLSATVSTGRMVLRGTGNAEGEVQGTLSIGGNATVGWNVNAETMFQSFNSSNSNVLLSVQVTFRHNTILLHSSSRNNVLAQNGAGRFSSARISSIGHRASSQNGLNATSSHQVSGQISWSRTLTTRF